MRTLTLITLSTLSMIATGTAQAQRQAPLGVRTQFNSIGTGTDQIASQALRSLAKTYRYQVTKSVQRNWGREGEQNTCVELKDPTSAYRFRQAISRVAVIRQGLGKGSVGVAPALQCNAQALELIQNPQLGPFASRGERPTLKCQLARKTASGYFARIHLFESMQASEPVVRAILLQSAPNARFAPVEWEVTALSANKNAQITYSGSKGVLRLTPSASRKKAYNAYFDRTQFHCTEQ